LGAALTPSAGADTEQKLWGGTLGGREGISSYTREGVEQDSRSAGSETGGVMAVAHTMLIIGYHMLKTGQDYHELGGNYFEQINKDQLQRYFVKRLQRLGLNVTLEPATATA